MQKIEKKFIKKFVLRCKTAKGIFEIFSEDKNSLFVSAVSNFRKCQKVILKQLPDGEILFHSSHGRIKFF